VLCECVPGEGQWQSRPAGAHQSGRRSKDVTSDVAVDGFGQACCFLASFGLSFALRGSAGEAITDEARGLGPGEDRWHIVRSRELELLFGR
jgi:hypothetical protein